MENILPKYKSLKVILLIFAISLSFASYSQSLNKTSLNLVKIDKTSVLKVAEKITQQKYPNADTVLLDDYEKIKYNSDGTSKKWDEVYEKILTEKGKRENKTLSFYYTFPYSTVTIPLLEIIKQNGDVIPVNIEKNSKEMVNSSQMSSNIYNPNSKILKVSIPKLEIGDIIHHISFRNTVKTRVKNTWSDYFVLEYYAPIIHYVIDIDAPKDLPLKNIEIRDEVKNTISFKKIVNNDSINYKWEIKDVPRMFKEPSMPPLHTVVQRILVSTIPKWEDVSTWYWNLCKPRLAKTTDEIRDKVNELISGISDRQERIETIFQFVSQKIRYMGITTEKVAPGYEPHDVSLTFENKYGVCRDKAALLVAMLRIAGFKAYPVLINNGAKKDMGVPNPYFNHAISCVENNDGSYILMDSTDENTKDIFPVYLCDKSYLVAKPEGERLRTSQIVPATENLMEISTDATLDDEGNFKATTILDFMGINDGAYRGFFLRTKADKRRELFEGRLKRLLPGVVLTDIKIEPVDLSNMKHFLSVTLKYQASNIFIKRGKTGMFPIPWIGNSFGIVNFILNSTGLKKRKFPFVTDIACGVKERISIDTNFKNKRLITPKYKLINEDKLTWNRMLFASENKIIGESEFIMKGVEFLPNEYLALKNALKDIEYDNRKMPLVLEENITKINNTNADIITMNINSDIKIHNESSYSIVKTIKKKILTYAGKKNNAEISLNYNPIWETIELLSASVTDTDGNVKYITDKEKNLMDADWVARAPRYPGAKTLVASLPNVDVDSVIEYSYKYTMKNTPFISIMGNFVNANPIQNKNISISIPQNMSYFLKEAVADNITSSLEDKNGNIIYKSTLKNQVGQKPEANTPDAWVYNPYIFLSTGNWQNYANLLNERFIKATTNQSKTADLAKSLVKMKEEEYAIIAIRDYVAKNIRHTSPSFIQLPLDCISDSDVTLNDGYGHSADQAILLYTLLKTANFAPEFVLVSSYQNVSKELNPLVEYPQRWLFNEILVKVSTKFQTYYLNDTNQYDKLGVTESDKLFAMELSTGKQYFININDNLKDTDKSTYNIEIDVNGDATIQVQQIYTGTSYGQGKRFFAELPPEERRRYYLELVSDIALSAESNSELKTQFKDYPGTKDFSVEVANFAVKEGKYLYFRLPGVSLASLIPIRSDNRKLPYAFSDNESIEKVYNVTLPKNIKKIKLVPPSINWISPDNKISINIKTTVIKPNNNNDAIKLKILYNAELSPEIIEAYDYHILLDINKKLSHPKIKFILSEQE